ncbi:MAG: carbohydrate binding domain-containing protein [Bacteroidaceae bacterium]|nr:carbohydrate binding domain-containing protein [Bacteroidaceae bacterium]
MKRSSLLIAILTAACTMKAQVVIDVDAKQLGPEISPVHYGLFYEDINHAADGGLYAELIRNRSFEDNTMRQDDLSRTRREHSPISNWFAIGNAQMALTQQNLLNKVQHNALKVSFTAPGDGVRNEGFWGMNAVAGRKYQLSFFARSDKAFKGTLTASLISAAGENLGSTTIKVKASGKWTKYTATIIAKGNDPKAQFALTSDKAGELQLDVVSLFPPTFKNRPNGMRPDLAQMLADMHPSFLRFPGGCFVEGQGSPDNAFRWKRTIGPIEEREGHPNVNWGYRTTDGIGFHEYLQLSEDIGAKPLYVVNVGIWHGGCDPYDKIDSWIQECLDALEYANGDLSTPYGKLRAKNGHPEPFGLKYIEIGNENYNFHMDNNSDQSDHYPERYIQFYKAIKAKYPDVTCIGNVESWGTDDPTWRNPHPVDMVDEHYYRNPRWFAERFHKYDSYPRSSHKVYVGEYAVTSQFGVIGNMNAALGEAVFMMGMENNSDVVAMNSYAPIFVNENDARWRPDMIRFNSSQSMGTPSYYVQQLFPNNVGTRVIKTDCTWSLTKPEAKQEEHKPVQVGVGSWNTNVHFRNPRLIVDGNEQPIGDLSAWKAIHGNWSVENGELVQRSKLEPAVSIHPAQISSRHYSYRVQAMKESGRQGFLMLVGYEDDMNYQWYNVGGWDNALSSVEQILKGSKDGIAPQKRFKVESNRWYDLQVDVDDDSLHCYIDGTLDFACKLQKGFTMEGVYASTTIDQSTNTMYVKVVNLGEGYAPGVINLKNCKVDTNAPEAVMLTKLAAQDGTDENTLDHPHHISPVSTPITSVTSADKVDFHVAPFSVNILKLKLQK